MQTVDSKGLITVDRPGLQEHKKCQYRSFWSTFGLSLTGCTVFARTDYQGPPLTNLVDIINHVKPTALLGLSTLRVSISLLPWVPYGEFCAYRMRSPKKSSRRWHRTTRVRLSSRFRIRCR